MSQSSSLGKWLAGIAATIIGAVVIWSLTHPGGLFNPVTPTPQSKPNLKVIDFKVTNAFVGERAQASLTVYNEGDATGEACKVWWYSGSAVGMQLKQGLLPQQAAVSTEFGLRPKETQQISLSSLVYTELGTFRSYAQVECSGVNITSNEFYKDVIVVPRP